VKDLLQRLRSYLQARSARERLLIGCVLLVAGTLLLQAVVIAPLRAGVATAEREGSEYQTDLLRAQRMAREILRLRADVERVETRIKPGESTNLFTLLETLAGEAQMRDRLESIKPKQPSDHEKYRETRVEVSLKGATLEQAVQFLYKIESADALLIIRSLRMKSRRDDVTLLDVSFSVSSFESA
jgi:hypothetical protein